MALFQDVRGISRFQDDDNKIENLSLTGHRIGKIEEEIRDQKRPKTKKGWWFSSAVRFRVTPTNLPTSYLLENSKLVLVFKATLGSEIED